MFNRTHTRGQARQRPVTPQPFSLPRRRCGGEFSCSTGPSSLSSSTAIRARQMRIVLARRDGAWDSLGDTRGSTGQAGRRDYYLTPTGIFFHTDLILDRRAEGTFNSQ